MAQHASGWQAGSPVWLGGWARADTSAVRLLGEGGRAVRDAGGERRESTAGRGVERGGRDTGAAAATGGLGPSVGCSHRAAARDDPALGVEVVA